MRKPRSMTFKSFVVSLTEINNFLSLFLGLDASNKMEMEDLNENILHTVPNGWAKQSYLQGWDLSWRPTGKPVQFSSTWKFLNGSTKGGYLLKYPLGQKPIVTVTSGNEREEKLPCLPTPRRSALASAKKNSGCPSDATTEAKKTFLLHVPGHSLEECKVLKVYSGKYSAQRPHTPIEACSGGNPKRAKAVEFNDSTQEVNTMENRGDTIPT